MEILEIGAGTFAALCGCLSRYANQTIDAVELEPGKVEAARRSAPLNGFDVNMFQSVLFDKVPNKKYDLVFWNVPYYWDPNDSLRRLFQQAPDHLAPGGELVIGYNTRPLPRAAVLQLLAKQPRLKPASTLPWWWNLHDVQIITPTLPPSSLHAHDRRC